MNKSSEDEVNHPAHYTQHPSGIECIQISEHFNFCLGNAIKYIWRAGLKSDDKLKDLKKAAWYIDREIERLGGSVELVKQSGHSLESIYQRIIKIIEKTGNVFHETEGHSPAFGFVMDELDDLKKELRIQLNDNAE